MRKYNILVTGVGAIIGYGIISSLRNSKYDCFIVGIDIFYDAAGQVWCDRFEKAVPAADEKYIPFLKGLIDKYNIDLVFFGTEQEIKKCYECQEELNGYYKRLVINKNNLIELAEDKWCTTCFLKENGFKYIPGSVTASFEEAMLEFGLPLLMKPRRSYASKGICKVSNEKDYNAWKEEFSDQFMVQKLVGDEEHEYTAATFGFGDGSCIKPIVMRRKLSKAGATDKAIVEPVPGIEEEIYAISKVLKPYGPTNFQFRLDGGEYLLLEINPRISASTSIRTAFGYNEAEMCIDYFVEGIKPTDKVIRTGKAYRYIADAVEYNDSNNI